jgi:hypothetical protein
VVVDATTVVVVDMTEVELVRGSGVAVELDEELATVVVVHPATIPTRRIRSRKGSCLATGLSFVGGFAKDQKPLRVLGGSRNEAQARETASDSERWRNSRCRRRHRRFVPRQLIGLSRCFDVRICWLRIVSTTCSCRPPYWAWSTVWFSGRRNRRQALRQFLQTS